MELVPEGKDGVPVLEALAERVEPRLPATRVLLDAELSARAPTSLGVAVRAAHDAVEDIEEGAAAPWCSGSSREACERSALARAERVEQIEPEKCEGYALRARARIAGGHAAQGLAEMEKATDVVSDRVSCLKRLVALARRAGDMRSVDAALDKIVSAGCAEEAECAASLAWVAGQNEGDSNPRKALALYRRAYERAPDDDALLENVARMAATTGLHAEAAEDYERLARRRPQEARWKTAAYAEWASAVKGATKL
jgi:tetratricopeptide (TPR) repeat protein